MKFVTDLCSGWLCRLLHSDISGQGPTVIVVILLHCAVLLCTCANSLHNWCTQYSIILCKCDAIT